MKLGHGRPGTSTAFVDAASGETLLQIGVSTDGKPHIAYHLYNSSGQLVCDSDGQHSFPKGLRIEDEAKELLLLVPPDIEQDLEYRLYNGAGVLLTYSDGKRTRILGALQMNGTTAGAPRKTVPERD